MIKISNAASKARAKWNSVNYDQVKVSVYPEIASSFKAACIASGVSMASVLSQFMTEYGATTVAKRSEKKASLSSLSTKKNRSNTVRKLTHMLIQVRDAEEEVMDNIPENLRGAGLFDEVDERIQSLSEAIDILESIY